MWVVRGGKVSKRRIGTGVRTDTDVQVTAGLAAGDSVLTSGFEELREGQEVRVARDPAFDPSTVRPDTTRPATGTYRPTS